MKTCPYCAHANREGVLFCEECGHPFVGDQETLLATTKLMQQQAVPGRRAAWGTAHFRANASLVVRVREHPEALVFHLQNELVIGRSDPQLGVTPDLDLMPYGAVEQGVSRQHAKIQRVDDALTLIDLESTNGTYLNGQRLLPNQPRMLRDGDEVRLGRLVMHVFFG